MFEIRPARVEDAQGIAYVHVLSWQSTYQDIFPQSFLEQLSVTERAAQWQTWLEKDTGVYIALNPQDLIVGFVSAGPIKRAFQEYQAEIYALYLLKESQGHGLGRRLFHESCHYLRRAGYSNLLVWVAQANHNARGFYEKLGGECHAEKKVLLAGFEVIESAYVWETLV